MFELRSYQQECVDTIINNFKKSSKQLIQLPTGSGKTVIFLNYLNKHSIGSVIVCPTIDLKMQIYETGKQIMGEHRISHDIRSKRLTPHVIVTAQSLSWEGTRDIIYKKKLDTIIIDEAHHAQSPTYKGFIDGYRTVNKNYKLLGLTATPERRDERPLLSMFQDLTFSMNVVDLIKQGHLCNIRAHRINTKHKIADRTQNGDFVRKQLAELDTEARNQVIYKIYFEECAGKKTIIFCLNVDHAMKLANTLRSNGVAAEAISGRNTNRERSDIIARFKTGETMVLANAQLLTEGFDEPSIQAIIISRPTQSKPLYCQMIGRGLRPYPGKEFCELFELTDNHHKICTFNVAAGKEADFLAPYKKGIALTELSDELESVNIEDIILEKEPMSVINSRNEFLESMPPYAHQIAELSKQGIPYFKGLNYMQAAFLIWKHNLKRKYEAHKHAG